MSDYSKQDIPELQKALADKRESLRSFRFSISGSRARNVREGRELRKDIARIMTELRSRAISATK